LEKEAPWHPDGRCSAHQELDRGQRRVPERKGHRSYSQQGWPHKVSGGGVQEPLREGVHAYAASDPW
jgi:hypothetical protein